MWFYFLLCRLFIRWIVDAYISILLWLKSALNCIWLLFHLYLFLQLHFSILYWYPQIFSTIRLRPKRDKDENNIVMHENILLQLQKSPKYFWKTFQRHLKSLFINLWVNVIVRCLRSSPSNTEFWVQFLGFISTLLLRCRILGLQVHEASIRVVLCILASYSNVHQICTINSHPTSKYKCFCMKCENELFEVLCFKMAVSHLALKRC